MLITTKMKKLLFIILGLIILSTAGCVKFPSPEPNNPTTQIPVDFDWKTVQEVNLNVQVGSVDGISDSYLRIIKVYSSSFLKDGSLMATGAAKPGSPFSMKLTLPTALQTLYVQEILPNGNRTTKSIEITGPNLTLTSSAISKSSSNVAVNASFSSPTVHTPTNYDVVISNNSPVSIVGFNTGESSIHGNTYKSYYIPEGVNRTASIDMGNNLAHAILYVKGTYTVNSRANLNKVSIVVLPGGTVNVAGVSTGTLDSGIPPVIYIYSGGSFYSSKDINLSSGTTTVNKGIFTINDDVDINNNSKLYNESNLTVTRSGRGLSITNSSQLFNSGNIDVKTFDITMNGTALNDIGGRILTGSYYQSNGTVMTNHHEIVSTVSMATTSGATVNNFCNITTALSDLQGGMINLYGGSLWESQTFKINLTTINMFAGSMFLTNNFTNIWGMTLNSTSADYSVFKVTGTMPSFAYAGSQISGRIEVVYSNLVEGTGTNGRSNYSNLFVDGLSILNKTQTKNIVATTCNDGAGQIVAPPPAIVDSDGDGVQESEDYDDNDASVAFVSYFPSETGWASYAFEDLWPWKGDYDMNDLVLGFKITNYSNSSNKFTKMKFDYIIKASGSSKDLAAAIQLDKINASNVASVTGDVTDGTAPFLRSPNGTESGVTLAVIPLFNRLQSIVPDQAGAFVNTVSGNHTIIQPRAITISFVNPVESSDLSVNTALNFFIIRNEIGQVIRGLEIHLPTFSPTSKADMSMLTGKQLHPFDKYKSVDGMMWGIMIPELFEHPFEGNVVSTAYLKFDQWALSGGTEYPDWYKDLEGYRDNTKIYSFD